MMINTKLLLLEYATHAHNEGGRTRLEAIRSIKEILSQIDFTAEEVPINEPKRLMKLLASLKGNELNKTEMKLVYEIAIA